MTVSVCVGLFIMCFFLLFAFLICFCVLVFHIVNWQKVQLNESDSFVVLTLAESVRGTILEL